VTLTVLAPLLEVRGLELGYGHVPVVRDLDLTVARGEVVVLLGPNGAGKTTTLQAIAGELDPRRGEVRFDGELLAGSLQSRARRGLAYLPEGRTVLRRLTVLDNLRLGRGGVDRALELAPELQPLLHRRAGLLSGGEQQILCMARLLATRPALLMADEMSLGLAPFVVDRMLAAARRAADDGSGVLLVEQHAHKALAIADRALVMSRGKVVISDAAPRLLRNIDEVERVYLAGADVSADAPPREVEMADGRLDPQI
jgi:branched-chain amino acid transport system ATP-binding protein